MSDTISEVQPNPEAAAVAPEVHLVIQEHNPKQVYGKEYRRLLKDAGYVVLHRYLPRDLFTEVLKLIATHKAQNFDLWRKVPTPNKQTKG
jgi:hypothetical protein